MTKDTALKMAIEALELINEHAFKCGLAQDAIQACKEALAQPQKQWVGLSDEQIKLFAKNIFDIDIVLNGNLMNFARDIEAKLKELNHD